jgi:hypothetical protein
MRIGLYGSVAAVLAAVVLTFSVVILSWRLSEGRSVHVQRDGVISSGIMSTQ